MRSALPGSRRAPGPSPSRLLPVLLVLVAPEVAPAPSPQVIPQPYNRRIGERYAGGDVSRYEAQYGTPEFRGIDDDHARPWPLRQSIRTIAVLAVVPGRGDDSAGLAYTGRVVEYDNIYTYYMLCGQRYCIALAPVEEMLEFFQQHAHPWLHRSVEVIGAIDQIGTPRDGSCPCDAFRAWSIQLFEETAHPSGRPDPTLETLVRGPDAAAGRTITVQGTFRGANLFEDLPPETRRDPGDWVLKDGPFSVWVTGRAPKGKGFSLDPRSRSECDWRLEVTGKVETAHRYVYLRARSVALLRRERDAAEE